MFRGDDEALAALLNNSNNLLPNKAEGSSKHSDAVASIRGNIENSKGVGRETILAVNKARGVESRKKLVEMAIGMLKDSGEHDL